MNSIYIVKLGLRSRPTNIDNQKIDGLAVDTHDIIFAGFLLQNS